MPRDTLRQQIAHLAARLLAEDGVQDYAQAKRKAARQLGVSDGRHLPDNLEVESALKDYQALFHGDEPTERLQFLREQALTIMRILEKFNPRLVGSVLNGSATRFSDINIQLFPDNAKEVELFLLGKRIPYRASERQQRVQGELRSIPVLMLEDGPASVELTLYDELDLRQKTTGTERARIDQVEALMTENHHEEGIILSNTQPH
jgi:hypothetical protein